MAVDAKKAKNGKNTENPETAEETTGSKNNKKKLMLIIGLAVALVVVSIGGTIFALKMLSPSTPGANEEQEEKTPSLAPAIYYPMTPNFTINFNVNGRQRYLQAEITLMYRDPTLDGLLKLHLPAIRNGLVMLLSGKNFDELQTFEGKEKLRQEALQIVQNLLKKEQTALVANQKQEDKDDDENSSEKSPELPTVEQVLFTNFVMQ